MKELYAIKVNFIQRTAHWGIYLIELLSLGIGFIFVLLFLTKYHEIQISIEQLQQTQEFDDFLVVELDQILQDHSFNHTSFATGEIYLEHHGLKKARILYIGQYDYDIYRLSSSLDDQTILMHSSLTDEWKLHQDDTLLIQQQKYVLKEVITKIQFKDRFVFHHPFILQAVSQKTLHYYWVIDPKNIDQIPKEHIINQDTFGHQRIFHIQSLRMFQRFVGLFSIIFICISMMNVGLILISQFSQQKRNMAIQWLCGQDRRTIFIQIWVDTNVILLLSYHVSLLLYLLLYPIMPDFFRFQLYGEIYLQGLMGILLFGLIVTWQVDRLFFRQDFMETLRV